jgi:cobalt-zinc-cadmium resistance protein CzcA
MIDSILSFAIRQRWLVMIGVLAMASFGAWNFTRLPIDAVPDITNVQVQINSSAPGYSPLEIEQRITFPIETAIGGLPRLENTWSQSRYGLSQVTVIFKDGTDIYFARQLVNERIQQVRDQLPAGIETAMGPVSTGLGEIYMFTVEARPEARKTSGEAYTPSDLRTIQDWIVRPQLRTVPGVNEVNTVGGFQKQFHVLPDPAQLMAYKLSFRDVMTALAANNANVGAGYIEHNGEQYLVRTPGQGRHGSAYRCGNTERQRSRAGHCNAADRRKQPRRGAARRRQTQGDRPFVAGGRDGAYRLRPDAPC